MVRKRRRKIKMMVRVRMIEIGRRDFAKTAAHVT